MSILIKNVLLINGTGIAPVKADVLVRGEKIAAIGYFPKYNADEIIDGLGTAYLAPGFIDVNSYSDRYLTLFNNPSQEDFLLQGVTTIIGGQGGISLGPVAQRGFELHKLWADTSKINFGFKGSGDFLDMFSKRKLGINFGTLIGHATIRKLITGDDFRDLNQKELESLNYIFEKALRDGFFGISFDPNFPLTAFSPAKEIKLLLANVEKYNAIATFKMRNSVDSSFAIKNLRQNFLFSIEEIIGLSKDTGAKVQINNFNCPKGLGKVYEEAISSIAENSAAADISYNLQISEFSIMPLFALLPSWARRGSLESIKKLLFDIKSLSKIKKEFPLFKSDDVLIFHAPNFEYLSGKSIKEFGETRGLNQRDSLLELMRITKLQGSVAVKNLSTKDSPKAFIRERAIITSSSPSLGKGSALLKSRLGYQNTFLKFFEMALKNKDISVEKAIKKISALPAKQYGLERRGMVLENYFADLVLLRGAKIDTVIVNGEIAVREGELTNILNGRILKRGHV